MGLLRPERSAIRWRGATTSRSGKTRPLAIFGATSLHWSGANVATLAERLAQQTGVEKGQHDYWVLRLASLFTHNAPGALLFSLPLEAETPDWKTFRAQLDKAGSEGVRYFLAQASLCFLDIVGMAGSFIAGYDPKWFEEVALPLLGKF